MAFLPIIGWVFLGLFSIYLLYCIYEAILNEPLFFREKNEVHIFKRTPKNLEIQDHLRKLEPYRPNFFLPGPWLKMGLTIRSPERFDFFTRRIHKFPDGGEVALDFHPPLVPSKLKNPTREQKIKDTPEMEGKWELESAPEGQGPLVIIVPGLSGCSHDKYLTSACREFWNSKLKIRTMIANRRGYTGIDIKGKYPLSWIRWEDIEDIIYWLRTVRKEKEIFIYGASLGGNYVHWHSGRKAELETGAPLRREFDEGHLVDHYPHLIASGHQLGTRVFSLGELAEVDGFISCAPSYDLAETTRKFEKKAKLDKGLLFALKTAYFKFRKRKNPKFLAFCQEKGIDLSELE